MKKTLEYIGIISLFIFSFIFTEKTATVLKEQDEIMIKIKEIQDKYYIKPKEAIIMNNTIIPGLNGQEIDLNESYYRMKKIGLFNETLLQIKKIKPKNLLKNNQNKFIISGNKSKNEVSLLFIIQNDKLINNLLYQLDKNNIQGNIFITGEFFEENNTLVNKISNNHLIGNLSYNNDYKNNDFIWMSKIIKKFNDNFCYTENLNEEILEICSKNKSYTIVPTTIIKTKPLMNISRKLNNGDIISIYVNDENIKQLNMVFNEIKTRGKKIVKLDKLLLEK